MEAPGNKDAATPPPSGANALFFLQDACLNHKYIRSRDASHIVERPERIRAVKAGLAVAISRLEELFASSSLAQNDPDDLAAALDRMNLANSTASDKIPLKIINSSASTNILNDPAVKFVHGDVDGDVYLENLIRWTTESENKIVKGESEVPEELPQNDLYLSPGSLQAISGAIGTVCEAIDVVVQNARDSSESAPTRAFCAIRPPGHHCGEDSPCGFCFVNNVAVGAAHAYLKHGINRVVIFDIDLHHGNGTQSIAWQINEETYRKILEEDSLESKQPGLKVYYGSLHDILSFPCEDGKQAFVQAASVSIHGNHGQYIENIHLEPYESEEDFFVRLYQGPYSKLIEKAQHFVDNTAGTQEDVLVIISCGLDACEHEYPSMSRHNRRVPVEFYHRFARDVCSFADKYANGKVVSVLEGGYSDRALISGILSHLSGLVDMEIHVCREWWSDENLDSVEKAIKKKRGGRPSQTKVINPWVERATGLLATMEAPKSTTKFVPPAPPATMTLRDRKNNNVGSGDSSPSLTPVVKDEEVAKVEIIQNGQSATKKLPRVILKVGPPPSGT